tara:strand:+ start:376 stop:924 length:549 start_codon:yes stop_codon:yes gene_type:complete
VPASLTNEEIDAICAAKQNISAARRCPREGDGTLSAAAKGALLSPSQRLATYLGTVFQGLASSQGSVPRAYVYAHTHQAEPPKSITVTGLASGPVQVQYANTGAFQRVATKAQVERIIAQKRASSVMAIQPEQLPPCYSFIEVAPYATTPALKLMSWRAESSESPRDSRRLFGLSQTATVVA